MRSSLRQRKTERERARLRLRSCSNARAVDHDWRYAHCLLCVSVWVRVAVTQANVVVIWKEIENFNTSERVSPKGDSLRCCSTIEINVTQSNHWWLDLNSGGDG
ncbi:Hypothetical predicted protein [Olea europaea subsp. europaea]|uniref:Uncharacterized protein n=1 Tax=Olea europaea subsp. europaea TaxID=158383 RepID=A0A8S0TNM9_OLEEU|nr:Hypothetical predicted protein [Olea europaea subsp. europaea]